MKRNFINTNFCAILGEIGITKYSTGETCQILTFDKSESCVNQLLNAVSISDFCAWDLIAEKTHFKL
jgi:hypothetical protein